MPSTLARSERARPSAEARADVRGGPRPRGAGLRRFCLEERRRAGARARRRRPGLLFSSRRLSMRPASGPRPRHNRRRSPWKGARAPRAASPVPNGGRRLGYRASARGGNTAPRGLARSWSAPRDPSVRRLSKRFPWPGGSASRRRRRARARRWHRRAGHLLIRPRRGRAPGRSRGASSTDEARRLVPVAAAAAAARARVRRRCGRRRCGPRRRRPRRRAPTARRRRSQRRVRPSR